MAKEITTTDRAAEKIRRLLTGATEGSGLRVTVVEGGCSGFEYQMEMDFPAEEDRGLEKDGAHTLLGHKSIIHLDGTDLDYKDALTQSGFVFNNPNVKATSGRGTSFST